MARRIGADMTKNLLLSSALILSILSCIPGTGRADAVNKTLFGTAVKGYDVVAYFTRGKPVRGSGSYTHRWRDATWRFASAEHRDLFAADPERYAPQYGGYCAWAVSQGTTAGIDPEAWKIVDGKLYLNYSGSIQERWKRDIPGHITRADANWPRLRDR
jgi:hypothetical protein